MRLLSDEVVRCYTGAEGPFKGIELEVRLGCAEGVIFLPTFGAGLMTRKDSAWDVAKGGYRGSLDRNWRSRDGQRQVSGTACA